VKGSKKSNKSNKKGAKKDKPVYDELDLTPEE